MLIFAVHGIEIINLWTEMFTRSTCFIYVKLIYVFILSMWKYMIFDGILISRAIALLKLNWPPIEQNNQKSHFPMWFSLISMKIPSIFFEIPNVWKFDCNHNLLKNLLYFRSITQQP